VPAVTTVGQSIQYQGAVTGRWTKTGSGAFAFTTTGPANTTPGGVATLVLFTTIGQEHFPCAPMPASPPFTTTCAGSTIGDVILGANVSVLVPLVGGSFATLTGTPVATATPTPTPGAGFTEVYFANRGSATSPPFATLDIDDVSGFGPETITIERLLPGQYTYAVHNFSNEAPLSGSGAQVQVLSPTGVVATFNVPAGSGRWWTVLTLDGTTGAITPVNTITNSPPLPSAVGP
jgi:hypothetical protein